MKKLLLLSAMTAIIATGAFAQAPKEEDKSMKKDYTEWEKKLKEDLKLTPDQVTKYDAISKECNAKIDAVLKDAALNKDEQKQKKMELKKEKESKILEILTPEQQAKYKEIVEKKKKESETASKQGY